MNAKVETQGARGVAFAVLLRVAREGAYANLALQQALRHTLLSARDKALCTEIVYGTLQRQRAVDLLLAPYCNRPLSELSPEVLVLLRMTAYQLTFLDRVPAYAAIHEAVELCKAVQPRAAGFVNGVLRHFSRDPAGPQERLARLAARAAGKAQAWGILYSYPDWLVQRWIEHFGSERTERILESCNQQSSLSLRVNRMRSTVADVIRALADENGISATPSGVFPDGLRLERGFDVESARVYRDGWVTVQDEAAMLVAPLLHPEEHRRVLDLCAAPGTKTTHIAELQADVGEIDACDIHPHKLRLLHAAAGRLGLHSIRTRMMDGRLLPGLPGMAESYDAVLLDAPCTGFGVLRHRPDIRWRRTPEDVAALAKLQAQLLAAAVQLVRPGGAIVYSTCTLLPEENEQVLERVMASSGGDIVADDIRPDLPPAVRDGVLPAAYGVYLTPDAFGTDGFFMARLRKRR